MASQSCEDLADVSDDELSVSSSREASPKRASVRWSLVKEAVQKPEKGSDRSSARAQSDRLESRRSSENTIEPFDASDDFEVTPRRMSGRRGSNSKPSTQSDDKEGSWQVFFRKFSEAHQYKSMLDSPMDDIASLCEAMCRLCWDRCQNEQEVLRKHLGDLNSRLEDLNLNSMKHVSALKAQIADKAPPKQASQTTIDPADLIELYEPLKYMEETTKELIFTILADKMRQIMSGSAPKSLMKSIVQALQQAAPQAGGDLGNFCGFPSGAHLVNSEEIEELQKTISKKDKQLQDKQNESVVLRGRIDSLGNALEEAKEQKTQLESANVLLEQQNAELVKRQAELEQTVEEQNAAIASLKLQVEKIEQLQQQVDALQKRQAELEQAIEEHEANIASLNEQLATSKQELQEMDELKRKAEERVTTLEQELNEWKAKAEELEQWKTKAEEMQQQVATLELELEEMHEWKRKMEEQNEASKREAERMAACIEELEAQNAELQERLQNAEVKVQELQAELEAVTAQFANAKGEIERLEKRAEEAEAKVRKAETEIDELREASQQLQLRAETAEAQVKAELARRSNAKDMSTQTKLKGETIEEQAEENKRLKCMLEEAKSKLQGLMEELQKKGLGDQVEELSKMFNLQPIIKAKTCFDRLYNDAQNRIDRMEKLRKKYSKDPQMYSIVNQMPDKEQLQQAMESSNIEEQVRLEETRIANERAQQSRPAESVRVSALRSFLPAVPEAPVGNNPLAINSARPYAPPARPSHHQQNVMAASAFLTSRSLSVERKIRRVPQTPRILPSIADSPRIGLLQ